MEGRRPDPDALLQRVQAEKADRSRGRLKVFFGASPGVGKTYAMLEAAQRRRAAGDDVLVGWVETHGRAETARLLEGLPRLPARSVEYRGTVLAEFDLDAALARRSRLLLLDELAHTNAPGSRHAKRWQDAQELLDAGTSVWTTLNVQHLESLNDLVARITEVTVRETVPDRLLEEADEVEFVDLPPDELLQRLREGKVYVPEQAGRAARGFFRKGNITALRELALRRTADHVDADMRDYRRAHAIAETWPVAERVLVCIRPNPDSGRLIRAASRLATRLGAPWTVTSVESPAQPALSPREREALAAAFKLAEQLGATTAVLGGEGVGEALLAYARAHNVSKIVLGKPPARRRWRDRLRPSPLDVVVGASGEIDVYVISGEAEEPAPAPAVRPAAAVDPRPFAWAAAVVAACTVVCWPLFPRFDRSNLVMVYLLGVAFVATRFGRWPSALAAALSVGAFDFFFVPPHLTFAVTDTQYVVTFAVMLVVSLLISSLAVRVKDQAEAARQRERRTEVLYALSRELAAPHPPEELARLAGLHVQELVENPSLVLLPDAADRLQPAGEAPTPFTADVREAAVADWVFRNRRPAGKGTDTLPAAAFLYLPLPGAQATLGVLALQPRAEMLPLAPDQSGLLEALARQIAAAVERALLERAAGEARVQAERERLRGTLLSSVSHDLRTPLSAITGAASSLLDDESLDGASRRELLRTVLDEAQRLNRLVSNLLDMTRLESGTLQLGREWHSMEEIVGAALARANDRLGGRRVLVEVPDDLPLVPVDPILVEQLLVNLLENAAKYTPPAATVRLFARAVPAAVEVALEDDGPGLPVGEEEKVFEKFYRPTPGGEGFGLGLAICRAIVSAHGGHIGAEGVRPHGARFLFTLPIVGTPPPLREEAGADGPA
jgi:two-component system, OmpR family, sensor histidine kinase KdpD